MGSNIAPQQQAASTPNAGAVLTPALSPLKAIRKVAYCEVSDAILPKTYEQRPKLPLDDPEKAAAVLREIPDRDCLIAARKEVFDALDAPADVGHIVQIVTAIIRLKTTVPSDKKAGLIDGLSFFLHFEIDIDPVSPHVLAAALYDLAKSSPFMPDASEVLAKLPKTRSLFEQATRRLEVLIDARDELEICLESFGPGAWSGHRRAPPCPGEPSFEEEIMF